MEFLNTFLFLRPWWLLILPFWLLLSLVLWRQGRGSEGWSSLCDPALLGYLTGESTQPQRSGLTLAGLMVAGVATVVALAGPAWKQLPQPVFQAQSALVIVLDLSHSMLAEDLRPSRLIRARQKLQDILKQRHEGQTGLIVFAGSAFDVVPLTTDNKAIVAMLEALEPSLMPLQGSRASLALERAGAMFKRGTVRHGSVVLLTDGVDENAVPAAEKLVRAGHQLSVLGIGTDTGAPIPAHNGDGGFLKDRAGNIVIPRLEVTELQALADAGNGVYQAIRLDDLDVKNLPGIISAKGEIMKKEDLLTDHWREEGPWLVLLFVLPLLLMVFRRGALLSIFLMSVLSPDLSHAIEWKDVWQTPDQQGQTLLQQEKPEEAAEAFEDAGWKAAALYRAKEYKESAKTLDGVESVDAWYNRGNALAKSGELKAAIEAYEHALGIDKTHEDTIFNLALLKKAMEKQQSEQKKSGGQSESGENDESEQEADEKKQGDQSSDQNPEQSEQQSSSQDEQEQSDNKNESGENDESEQQPGEKKQGDQSSDQNPEQPEQQPDEKKQGDQSSGQNPGQQEQQSGQKRGSDDQSSDAQEPEQQQPEEQSQNEQPQAKQDDQSRDESEKDQEQEQQSAQASENGRQDEAGAEEEKTAAGEQDAGGDMKKWEEQKAQQQWLRRIPDDPGGLLRRKFDYQYKQRKQPQQSKEGQAW